MSIFRPLAKAIKEQLIAAQNAGTFSQTAVIDDPIDSMREDEDLKELRVDVLIGDKTCEPLQRVYQKNMVRMDICVRQIIGPVRGSHEERRQHNELMSYVEQLDEYLAVHANRRPPQATWAAWQNSETVIPFSPALLRQHRLFYSLFRITYFVATGPQDA